MSRKIRYVLIWNAAIWALAIGVAMMPVTIVAWKQRSGFESAFREYTEALIRVDYVRAYALSDPAFRAVTPYEQFVAQQAWFVSTFGRLKSVDQGETVVHGHGRPLRWTAVKLNCERGVAKFVYGFENAHDRWLMHGYKRE